MKGDSGRRRRTASEGEDDMNLKRFKGAGDLGADGQNCSDMNKTPVDGTVMWGGDSGERVSSTTKKWKLFRRTLSSGQSVIPQQQFLTPDGPIKCYSSLHCPRQRKRSLNPHTRGSGLHYYRYSYPHPSSPQASPLSLLHHIFPFTRPDAKLGPWSSSPQGLPIPPARQRGGLPVGLLQNSCSCFPGACHHFLVFT